SIAAEGLGAPNSSRSAAVRALTGFQFAIVARTVGIAWVGANALETKASGNRTRKASAWADSGSLERSPTQPHAQLTDQANSSARPIPAAVDNGPLRGAHPTAQPVSRTKVV